MKKPVAYILLAVFAFGLVPPRRAEAVAPAVVAAVAAGSFALVSGVSGVVGSINAQIESGGSSAWFKLALDNTTVSSLVGLWLASRIPGSIYTDAEQTLIDYLDESTTLSVSGGQLIESSLSDVSAAASVGGIEPLSLYTDYLSAVASWQQTAPGQAVGGQQLAVGVYSTVTDAVAANTAFRSSYQTPYTFANLTTATYSAAAEAAFGRGWCKRSGVMYTGGAPTNPSYISSLFSALDGKMRIDTSTEYLYCATTSSYTGAITVSHNRRVFFAPATGYTYDPTPDPPPGADEVIPAAEVASVVSGALATALASTDPAVRDAAAAAVAPILPRVLESAAAGSSLLDAASVSSSSSSLVDSSGSAFEVSDSVARDLASVLSGSISSSATDYLATLTSDVPLGDALPGTAVTAPTSPALSVPRAVTDAPVSQSFGDRFSQFKTTVLAAPVFSVVGPSSPFLPPAGSGSSVITVDIGMFGPDDGHVISLDLADFSDYYPLMRYLCLFLTAFIGVRVLFLKRG